MHAWEQIQLAVDHIEAHIEEEIKTEELAKIASLSPFYFQRLFSRLRGNAPLHRMLRYVTKHHAETKKAPEGAHVFASPKTKRLLGAGGI